MTEQASVMPASASSPGRMLAEARKGLHLSVDDVASKLRLTPRQIEALEADEYAKLPGATFVRGFIRSYAKLLHLDPEAVLAAYHGEAADIARIISVPHQNIQFSERANPRNRPLIIAAIVILLLAIGLFAAWRWENQLSDYYGKVSPSSVPAPGSASHPQSGANAGAPVSVPPAPQVASSDTPSPYAPSPAREPSPTPSIAQTESSATLNTQTQQPDPQEPRKAGVHLSFAHDSWVEVRDGTGAIIFAKVNPAGSEQDLTVQPPLSFVIGNAVHVKMTYNGEPFDLAPHTRATIARFALE